MHLEWHHFYHHYGYRKVFIVQATYIFQPHLQAMQSVDAYASSPPQTLVVLAAIGRLTAPPIYLCTQAASNQGLMLQNFLEP